MPNIFSAYADTAYALDQMDQIADLSDYLTDDDRNEFIADYLSEGDFPGDGSIDILPVAKSTELLFLNETDWAPFAEATGASYGDLSTIEELVSVAQRYYEWTDAQTPDVPDDGHAFFGRDAMANYMLIGAKQLGCTIFETKDGVMTLNFDKSVARKLWDNYYVPFIKGYFTAGGRFRSDDMKTGSLIAYVGSSSSATFFPSQVITDDMNSHDITRTILPCPSLRAAGITPCSRARAWSSPRRLTPRSARASSSSSGSPLPSIILPSPSPPAISLSRARATPSTLSAQAALRSAPTWIRS